MRKLVISAAFLAVVLLLPFTGESYRDTRDNFALKAKCETYCKNQYTACRERAKKKKDGKWRDKALGICDTFHYDCMNRCKRFDY